MQGIGILAQMAVLGFSLPAPKPIVIDGEEREDYELRDEYEKIQRKESRLSCSERARVVYRHERRLRELAARDEAQRVLDACDAARREVLEAPE